MKLVIYTSLALALLAGLFFAVPLAYTQTGVKQISATKRREVYVDKTRLVMLHPGWEALREINATIAEVQAASGMMAVYNDDLEINGKIAKTGSMSVSVSKKSLEDDAARRASLALDQLELEKCEALGLRVNSMQKTLMDEAEIAIKAQAHEVEEAVAQETKMLQEDSNLGRINAQLKVSALKTASKVSGADLGQIQQKLLGAQSNLDGVNEVTAARNSQAMAVAKAKIDAIKNSEAAKVNERLQAYESKERKRIGNSIAIARRDTFRELGSSDYLAMVDKLSLSGKSGAVDKVVKFVEPGNRYGSGQELAQLRAAANAIQIRIREDVDRAVRSLAAKEGVNVTYTRGVNGAQDATQAFEKMMREHQWRNYGPVLNGASGS